MAVISVIGILGIFLVAADILAFPNTFILTKLLSGKPNC